MKNIIALLHFHPVTSALGLAPKAWGLSRITKQALGVLLIGILVGFFCALNLPAQIDSSLLRHTTVQDSSKRTTEGGMNMDAIYSRPFLNVDKLPVALGGYAEANWQHLATDGVSEGHQFQMRRMTLFVASTVSRRIKFLSEIELEEGGREIAIEFAAIDIVLHPLCNLRGGIVMNPIGAFNQNHDGPKWEFIDRPISATQMLPATWSNAGFGVFGKVPLSDWSIGYELYATGGFDNSIIDNTLNRTSLPAAKDNPERFEASASGEPLFSAKIALKNTRWGEIGISWMGGVYNQWQDDGIRLDEKRRSDVLALDANTTLHGWNTFITGEWAWVFVDVPQSYTQQYGNKQQGGFVDIVQPILSGTLLGWEEASLNIACRLEYVDWNVGSFNENQATIADDVWSIVPALSFRPSPQSVIRLNYRHQQQRDILGNPPARTGGFSLGVSAYF